MNELEKKPAKTERLRNSPNFNLSFTLAGRPYIAKDSEPYIQYWLDERYRILLSLFSKRHGASIEEVIEVYFRMSGNPKNTSETQRLIKAIADMREAGVLIGTQDDVSRYSKKIVEDYVKYRPFPHEVSDYIIRSASIGRNSQVLDLAGGPGDLALGLAKASDNVAMMDLSKGFLNAAKARAKRLGVNFRPIHESCNRLVYCDDEYDVITISQALHWLDDVMVCRGVCRLLRPDGSFFVIHGSMNVDDTHPLAYLLGHDSILGKKIKQSFASEVRPLLQRLTLLFDALDVSGVQRVDPTHDSSHSPLQQIVPVSTSFFQQTRTFGIGFLRGFLTPQHIAVTGMTPEVFWKDAEARCAGVRADQLIGRQDWAVLQFKRDGKRLNLDSLEACEVVNFISNIPL
jgi:ubiquinone/menaquinone biosynthesis C-methylase UbiE